MNLIRLSLLVAVIAFVLPANAQVHITGPTCVIAKNIYSYQFIGDSTHAPTITSVCIEGGALYEQNMQCVQADTGNGNTQYIQFVYVVWNDSIVTGSINAQDTSGIITSSVSVIPNLEGGMPDSASLVQIIAQDSIPAAISCSDATGGNCNPSYEYWWEQSPDNQNWTVVPDATSTGLQFSSGLNQTTYFRRGVRETGSNTTTFSQLAIVFIDSSASIQ